MDAAAAAAKFRALDAELAANSASFAGLEARVSLIEAENARLRKALARAGAMGREREEDPRFGRSKAVLRGSEHGVGEKMPGGSAAACDVVEVSDDEEGPVAFYANRWRTPEEGVGAVPNPRKRAARAVAGDSEDEDVNGGERGFYGTCDSDDEDSTEDATPAIRRSARLAKNQSKVGRAARQVLNFVEPEESEGIENDMEDDEDMEEFINDEDSSDLEDDNSEDEDVNGGDLGSGKDGVDDQEGGGKPSKKRGFSGTCDSDDKESTGEDATPAPRRSARLAKIQSRGGRPARQVLNFVEPKESEGTENDMEDDEDMEEFINDEDSSENASESAEESCDEPEGWKFEEDMLAAFDADPDLCLEAVCALYRKKAKEEQMHKATFVHKKKGSDYMDASRGHRIAQFLLDGDLYGPLKKTISDLDKYDGSALWFCLQVALNHSKQLFAIYQDKEDPYFQPYTYT